jgi:hypothetical protein
MPARQHAGLAYCMLFSFSSPSLFYWRRLDPSARSSCVLYIYCLDLNPAKQDIRTTFGRDLSTTPNPRLRFQLDASSLPTQNTEQLQLRLKNHFCSFVPRPDAGRTYTPVSWRGPSFVVRQRVSRTHANRIFLIFVFVKYLINSI